jgi:hypothetical protein
MSLPASVQLSKFDHPFRQPIGIKTALYKIAVTCTYLPHQSRTAPIHDRRLNAPRKEEKPYTLLASARESRHYPDSVALSLANPVNTRLPPRKNSPKEIIKGIFCPFLCSPGRGMPSQLT